MELEPLKASIRDFLLSGGAGFEGDPESATFSFDGVVKVVDAYMQAFFANISEVKIKRDPN